MSKIEVNQISSQCGSTLTIGQSGDTVTLASGATQTGFGRTGTVNWDTTAKTAAFTAVSGNGYFVNTTSGAITVTLPASPSAGDIVSISDYAGTAATNAITIALNGSNLEGGTTNGIIEVARQSVTLIYVDGTQGWVPTAENDSSFVAQAFVTATGGTITTCGDYKIHTFTSPGTFCVSCAGNEAGSNSVDYLVVAGGGGSGGDFSGGSGAGGFRFSACTYSTACAPAAPIKGTALPVSATAYPITVGGGGSGGSGNDAGTTPGTQGSSSIFSTITSAGGGLGGCGGQSTPTNQPVGGNGGSGGGARGDEPGNAAGGVGNTPPVSPPQGNPGSAGTVAPGLARGGGGGAMAAGSNPSNSSGVAGIGGGIPTSMAVSCAGTPGPVGSQRYFAGGGGGGIQNPNSNFPGGAGGGGTPSSFPGSGGAGTTNTGGGGGGGAGDATAGGAGGSGIVIIRYKYQ